MSDLMISAKGRRFIVEIDSKGVFYTTVDGEQVTAPLFETLKTKVASLLGTKPLNVPIVYLSRHSTKYEAKKGLITTIHSGNGNLMVRWDGHKGSEQFSEYGASQDLFKPGIDLKKVQQLHAACRAADKAYEDYLNSFSFDIQALYKNQE